MACWLMGTCCMLCQPRRLHSPSVYFNFLSLYVAADVMNALIQQSLIFHWQDISLVCFSTQLLIHFPHWYSVADQGMKEGFSLGADTRAHVASRCQGRMKGRHLLQTGRKWSCSARA